MAYLNIKVKIPDSRITFKKSSNPNYRYVYRVLSKKRNAKGTPTSDEIAIGKEVIGEKGFMYPNENYAKYYELPEQEITLPNKILENGSVTLLELIADKIGLTETINSVFGDDCKTILTIAIYMLLKGNVMMNIDFFAEESYLDTKISDKRISEFFASITREKELEFFKKWKSKSLKNNKSIAYDVTSISSYSNNEYVEYGYNRDKESLPQLNIGMLYGIDNKLPIGYAIYSGSIPDKSYFAYALELSKTIGVHNEVYVMDRGFYSKDNLTLCEKSGIKFLMAVSKTNTLFNEKIRKNKEEIRKIQHHIKNSNLYAVKETVEIDKKKYSLHIFCNTFSRYKEEESLLRSIDQLEEELYREMKPHKKLRYSSYYDVEYSEEGKIKTYKKNFEKIDRALETLGIFCILSNDDTYTSEEVIKMYGLRDGIEKSYDNLKNELDSKRFLTHSSATTNGKFFVKFISLILWSTIQEHKSNHKFYIEKTVERLLLMFNKIKCLIYEDRRLINEPLTKKQKDILKIFDIQAEDFMEKLIN